MEEIRYRGWRIEPRSHLSSRGWIAAAAVSLDSRGEGRSHAVSARDGMYLETREEADAYAIQLATIWIERQPPTEAHEEGQ